jgi:hypothetical protein
VGEYRDAGISGVKGRDGRPALDQMLNDAGRRKFDVVMAWAIDWIGLLKASRARSLDFPRSSHSRFSTPLPDVRSVWPKRVFRKPS